MKVTRTALYEENGQFAFPACRHDSRGRHVFFMSYLAATIDGKACNFPFEISGKTTTEAEIERAVTDVLCWVLTA